MNETKTPSKTLIQLHNELQWVETAIQKAEGELTPATEQELDEKLLALCEKVDAYQVVMDKLSSRSQMFSDEAKRLSAYSKTIDNVQKSLKERLKFVLSQREDRSLQGEFIRFYLSDGKPALEIDETALPKEFQQADIVYKPNREKIEKTLSEGKAVPGVSIRSVVQLRSGRPK